MQSLSYLRPHPPYLAPEPYNEMYHPDDVLPCVVGPSVEEEKAHQHPYFKFLSDMNLNTGNYRSGNYPRDEDSMRQLRATYYGLMTEIDDNIGRILALLKETGQYDHTVIVFVSDHGDQLGDHGLLGKGSYFDRSFHNLANDPTSTGLMFEYARKMLSWRMPNNQNISGGCIMKKVLVLITVSMLIFSSMGYAAGGKNCGSKGQGSTDTTGAGSITQTRGQ